MSIPATMSGAASAAHCLSETAIASATSAATGTPPLPGKARLALRGLLGLAVAVFIAGLFLSPGRIWPNFLITFVLLAHVGLAGIFFVAVQFVTKAGWSVVVRRVAEACAYALIPAALIAPLLFFGAGTLYEWSRPEAVAHDLVLQAKSSWLNLPFFMGRTIAVLLVWLGFTAVILRHSRAQDIDENRAHTAANVRLSAIFLVVFGLTVSMTSFDWLMSLEPHWYSTIFGAYGFAGLFQSGIAMMTVLVLVLRRAGYYHRDRYPCFDLAHGETHVVSAHHLHDLGKLLFAFSCFWAYLWFCQYMLIWYTNIPEETVYFSRRQSGGWGTLFVINLIVNWVIPFLALIARGSKRNPNLLLVVAVSVLFGRWLDLYIMVMPVFSADPGLSPWDIFTPLATLGLLLAALLPPLRGVPLVPARDPYLSESLHYHS
jgi:hypothetical protein